jgi:hypothetical protein
MVLDILTAISDDKSLVLFNTVALSSGNTDILISKLGITIKQYYSRMSALTNAGLVRRSNGKYSLTSLGRIVYEAQILIAKAKQNFMKLKAVDSIESSNQLTIEERIKIIDSLIVDTDLKEILLGRNKNEEKDVNRPLVAQQPYLEPQQRNAF